MQQIYPQLFFKWVVLYSLLLILLIGRSLFSIAHFGGILPLTFSLLLGLSLFPIGDGGSFSLSLNSDYFLLCFPLRVTQLPIRQVTQRGRF